MSELLDLPNIGKVAEKLLIEADIKTAKELRTIGSKKAFIRIRTIDPSACLHMLYGLEGAVQGIRDTELSQDSKRSLKEFFQKL